VVAVTMFPFPFQKELLLVNREGDRYIHNNFIPLYGIIKTIFQNGSGFGLSIFIRQIVGNIVLFVTLGYIMLLIYPTMKEKKVFLVGMCISIFIEMMQALGNYIVGYHYRIVDIDDIICNTLGVFVGIILYKMCIKVWKKMRLRV